MYHTPGVVPSGPRVTLLTDKVQKALCDAVSVGSPEHLACAYAGISESTLRVWRRRSEQGEEPFATLFAALEKARGEAAVGWLVKIEAAASDGNWQAAAWKLERRYPKDFGRQMIEHTGAEGRPIAITVVYADQPPTDDMPLPLEDT